LIKNRLTKIRDVKFTPHHRVVDFERGTAIWELSAGWAAIHAGLSCPCGGRWRTFRAKDPG